MNRYLLKADFNIENIEYEKDGNKLSVKVPMQKNNELLYGLSTLVRHLIAVDIYPSEIGFDLISLATLVYLADTRIDRKLHGQDSWTREISLQIPVSNVKLWKKQIALLIRMLTFLTGDIWQIEFIKREWSFDKYIDQGNNKKTDRYDTASLFSGGMDSLISTINLLEQKKNVLLISHAGDPFTKNAQAEISGYLDNDYTEFIHTWMNLWMVFRNDYLPEGGNDNNLRSRSFLFIAFGIFAISGTKNLRELLVPENGLIALNVPLDITRSGSYSTRTTHPFYLNCWNSLMSNLGLKYSVRNPYWNKTKGEMASECLNQDELKKLMKRSISCSSIAKARWKGRAPEQCGYCVPCIIRRAAMHKAFGNDVTLYTFESVRDMESMHGEGEGIQLRSFEYAINKLKKRPGAEKLYIHKSGPLSNDETYLNELADTYKRGLMEVDQWIQDSLKKEEVSSAD